MRNKTSRQEEAIVQVVKRESSRCRRKGWHCVFNSETNVIYKLEWVLHDEVLDGLLELAQKHLRRMGDLLLVSVVVVLNFELAHVEAANDWVLQARHVFVENFCEMVPLISFPVLQNDILKDTLGSTRSQLLVQTQEVLYLVYNQKMVVRFLFKYKQSGEIF